MNYVYEPTNIPTPPDHTKIKNYRCITCKHFPVCEIREDYMKTAELIENILGNPNNSYEVREFDFGFYGLDFDNSTEIFPLTIQIDDETVANFLSAKYVDKNLLRALYEINNFYYQFLFFWIDSNKYEASKGKELYYGLEIELPSAVAQQISDNLMPWREEQEQKEEEAKHKEIINTTYFSAMLNCDFYTQSKTPIKSLYPIIDDSQSDLYHLATYHIEPQKVGETKPSIAPVPWLYPVFIPKPECKNKPKPTWKRKDVEHD